MQHKFEHFLENDPVTKNSDGVMQRSRQRKAVENNLIKNWKQLEDAYNLIQDKISPFSSMDRQALVQLYNQLK